MHGTMIRPEAADQRLDVELCRSAAYRMPAVHRVDSRAARVSASILWGMANSVGGVAAPEDYIPDLEGAGKPMLARLKVYRFTQFPIAGLARRVGSLIFASSQGWKGRELGGTR